MPKSVLRYVVDMEVVVTFCIQMSAETLKDKTCSYTECKFFHLKGTVTIAREFKTRTNSRLYNIYIYMYSRHSVTGHVR